MTHWAYDSNFIKFEQALGSKFAAIVYVSKLARRRAKSVHNCITESQAISWVITGVIPERVILYLQRKKLQETADIRYAEDRLLYVEDVGVRDAVHETIQTSRESGHLIYSYKDVFDEPRKARVRILSNIIWDEMRKIRIDNMI